jgi:uncharacterized membrane protein HdeD (DUF308 family)
MNKGKIIFVTGGILTIFFGFFSAFSPSGYSSPFFLLTIFVAIGTILIGTPYLFEYLKNK